MDEKSNTPHRMDFNGIIPEKTHPWAHLIDQKFPCPDHPGEMTSFNPEILHQLKSLEGRAFGEGMAPELEELLSPHIRETWQGLVIDCPKCREHKNRSKKVSYLKNSGVPEILIDETFETFQQPKGPGKFLVDHCRGFAKTRLGILLIEGTTGTGKDHLAVATLKESGIYSGLFITQAEFLLRIREGYSPKGKRTVMEILDQYIGAGLLIISDLGLGYGGKDEMIHLHHVIDQRLSSRRPLIITTNLHYDPNDDDAELNEYLGPRLCSRFTQTVYAHLVLKDHDKRPEARRKYFRIGGSNGKNA